MDEIKRVLGVLEGRLTGRDWLVGDKMTFADMAFIPWNNWLEMILLCEEEKKFDGFPLVKAWHERMTSLPSWKKCMEHRAELMDAQGLMSNGMPKGVTDMEQYKAMIRGE
jgi:glutathione S-transferase